MPQMAGVEAPSASSVLDIEPGIGSHCGDPNTELLLLSLYSTNSKNPETDIGDQAEVQKSNTTKALEGFHFY